MAEPAFFIREASLQDLPAVLGLWSSMMSDHEVFDPRIRLAPGAEAAYRAYLGYHLSNEESRLAVASRERAGEVVGFCLTAINRNLPMFLPARYGYLSDLVVAAASRRCGIGRSLVEDSRRWLLGKGIDTIQLQVYSRNEMAAAFWRSMGFVSYYDRMWLDLA